MSIRLALCAAAAMLALPATAQAGLLDPLTSCTLTLSSSGTMTMAADGRSLSSQNGGGKGAVMLLVGVNLQPELIFSAPNMMGPSGLPGTPVTSMAIETASGVRTGYRTDRTVVRPGAVVDTLTVHSQIVNSQGFRQGNYTVSTVVTCQAVS